jgi:hypothetical protein
MSPSLSKAIEGYTLKDIFDTKLHGKPFELSRGTLVRDMFWLVERGIFDEKESNTNGEPTYVCMYPVRIWHIHNNDKYLNTRCDELKPGDLWGF